MRLVLALVVVLGVTSCGDDTSVATDAGADLAGSYCHPEVATCMNAGCGLPCDSSRDTFCTNHACFEPLSCDCVLDHWTCSWGSGSCDMATPRFPSDLAPTD